MTSSFSRDSQLPIEPGLPNPQDDLRGWLSTLTGRLYWWIKAIATSVNFMIQGYLYTVSSLPTAANKYRGQLNIVNGTGTTTDKLYLCIYDGDADGGADSAGHLWARVLVGIEASGAWTPGLIAKGAATTQSFTVADVQVGQIVVVSLNPAAPAGVVAFAMATAADTINVTILNLSGADQTLGATTIFTVAF